MHAAMSRFCMTARMSKPSGVRVSSKPDEKDDGGRKADDEKPVPTEEHIADGKVSA